MSIFVRLPVSEYSPTAFAAFTPPPQQRRNFDLDDARAMMWMAQLAYETDVPETIEAVRKKWRFDPVQIVKKQGRDIDTRAIVGLHPDFVVVAFAGTDPALRKNLRTDFDIHFNDRNTHSGFQDAVDVAWRDIEALIPATLPLYFTGHSLGGALAVLAAEKAHGAGRTPEAVYTFGMPRAGGKVFATKYNAVLGLRTFRLVHGGDIVPCSPVRDLLILPPADGAFQQVGQMMKCASGARFSRTEQPVAMDGNAPTFEDGTRENFFNHINAVMAGNIFAPAGPGMLGLFYRMLPFAIRDHLPDRYRAALEP